MSSGPAVLLALEHPRDRKWRMLMAPPIREAGAGKMRKEFAAAARRNATLFDANETAAFELDISPGQELVYGSIYLISVSVDCSCRFVMRTSGSARPPARRLKIRRGTCKFYFRDELHLAICLAAPVLVLHKTLMPSIKATRG